ncbi:MAG: PorT family protein [Bacteroidetes bacterium]|nr:PorT family protein [Bacteroidota bacterium]
MLWFNRIFLIIALVISFQAVNGQSKIRFNVHFDPQFAWLSSSDHDKVNPDGSIFHMQAGIQMDYFFQENYAFVLGFGINNLGGNLQYSDTTFYENDSQPVVIEPGQSVKMNLQYLEIPLGLKLKTEELGYGTFYLQLGFNPMFNINAHISTKDGTFDKELIKDSVKSFSLGYHVGAGIEYRLGGNTAAIGGIRWTSGLTNITEQDGANLSPNSISIHLGILF